MWASVRTLLAALGLQISERYCLTTYAVTEAPVNCLSLYAHCTETTDATAPHQQGTHTNLEMQLGLSADIVYHGIGRV
jgi:hypothetical protein